MALLEKKRNDVYKFMQPFQDIVQGINPYITSFFPESTRFLYSGRYVKRRRRLKYSLQVTAFENNLVQNDYVTTLFNGVKSFSEVNTTILKYRYKKSTDQSLTAVGRLKRTVLFRSNEIIYLTHRFMSFRNLTLKMSRNQYGFVSFNTYARPLNKLLFFSLFQKLTTFTLNLPTLIMYHHRKYQRLRVYYLGFRLILKKQLLNSVIKESPLTRHRYKRQKKVRNFFQLSLKNYLVKQKYKRKKFRLFSY